MGSWVDARPQGKTVSDGTYSFPSGDWGINASPDRNKIWFVDYESREGGATVFAQANTLKSTANMHFSNSDTLQPGKYRAGFITLHDSNNRKTPDKIMYNPSKAHGSSFLGVFEATSPPTEYMTYLYTSEFTIDEEMIYYPEFEVTWMRISGNEPGVIWGAWLEKWEENPSNQLVTSGYIDDGDE